MGEYKARDNIKVIVLENTNNAVVQLTKLHARGKVNPYDEKEYDVGCVIIMTFADEKGKIFQNDLNGIKVQNQTLIGHTTNNPFMNNAMLNESESKPDLLNLSGISFNSQPKHGKLRYNKKNYHNYNNQRNNNKNNRYNNNNNRNNRNKNNQRNNNRNNRNNSDYHPRYQGHGGRGNANDNRNNGGYGYY